MLFLNALIWAAVILIISYLLGDHENASTSVGVLAVAFAIQNGLTYTLLKDKD